MAKEKIRRVFLSYASENHREVLRFDRELRRRGVPLWRDRVNLPRGRDIHEEILAKVQTLRPAKTHLFYAGPPGLAILLGQQMSNAGQLIYEYHNAQKRYSPAFLLSS